jgi:hypothetical protein
MTKIWGDDSFKPAFSNGTLEYKKGDSKRYYSFFNHFVEYTLVYILVVIFVTLAVFSLSDLKPTIELNTEFSSIKDTPPYITVKNRGPVDALQMVIEFTSLRYIDPMRKIAIMSTGSDWRWEISKLEPLDRKAFKLPPSLLGVNTRMQDPLYYNVLEVSIEYLRDPDRKQFKESAFYFINSEGRWVTENDSSINTDKYKKIKQAALNRLRIEMSPFSDKLHRVKTDKKYFVMEIMRSIALMKTKACRLVASWMKGNLIDKAIRTAVNAIVRMGVR